MPENIWRLGEDLMRNPDNEGRIRRRAEFLRNTFLDQIATLEMVDTIFHELFPNLSRGKKLAERYGPEFLQNQAEWLHGIARDNVGVIFQYAESPIELIFFNTVNTLALGMDAPIFFVEPMAFTKELVAGLEERTGRANALIKWYHQRYETGAGWAGRFMEWVKDTEDYSDEFSEFLYYRVCDRLFGTRYLSMQAEFPEVVPGPFPVRVDAFVYLADFSVKTIIECDGFAHHKEEHAFIRDRQKDRFFKKKGFEVIRFAGSEIHHDPPECALQLVNRVFGHDS